MYYVQFRNTFFLANQVQCNCNDWQYIRFVRGVLVWKWILDENRPWPIKCHSPPPFPLYSLQLIHLICQWRSASSKFCVVFAQLRGCWSALQYIANSTIWQKCWTRTASSHLSAPLTTATAESNFAGGDTHTPSNWEIHHNPTASLDCKKMEKLPGSHFAQNMSHMHRKLCESQK